MVVQLQVMWYLPLLLNRTEDNLPVRERWWLSPVKWMDHYLFSGMAHSSVRILLSFQLILQLQWLFQDLFSLLLLPASITRSGSNSDFTSTLQVNASRRFARSDTTVECRNLLGVNESSRFTVASITMLNIFSQIHIHFTVFWLQFQSSLEALQTRYYNCTCYFNFHYTS